MHDRHTCHQKAHEPFFSNFGDARLNHDYSSEHVSPTITHGNQTTYKSILNARNIKNTLRKQSYHDLAKIFQVLGNLARFTNVKLPSSIPMLVVLTHEVPHPTKDRISQEHHVHTILK